MDDYAVEGSVSMPVDLDAFLQALDHFASLGNDQDTTALDQYCKAVDKVGAFTRYCDKNGAPRIINKLKTLEQMPQEQKDADTRISQPVAQEVFLSNQEKTELNAILEKTNTAIADPILIATIALELRNIGMQLIAESKLSSRANQQRLLGKFTFLACLTLETLKYISNDSYGSENGKSLFKKRKELIDSYYIANELFHTLFSNMDTLAKTYFRALMFLAAKYEDAAAKILGCSGILNKEKLTNRQKSEYHNYIFPTPDEKPIAASTNPASSETSAQRAPSILAKLFGRRPDRLTEKSEANAQALDGPRAA